jgi:predicted Rossmann fold nucleotide-binding protein DprA/Smf involved in DNA uptake
MAESLPVAALTPDAPGYPERLCRALGEAAPARLAALGDPGLLREPLLRFVCCASCPGDVILAVYDLALALRDAGVPVVSGFHSPIERECLGMLLRGTQPVSTRWPARRTRRSWRWARCRCLQAR